jgi:hypothetical protein
MKSAILLLVLLASLCPPRPAPAAAQPGYAVMSSGTVPLRAYVGDGVELRVRLRLVPEARARTPPALTAPKKLPEAAWLELRQVRVSAAGPLEWDVRVALVSFAPGPTRLPPLDLGAIRLEGLTIETASILQEKKVEGLAPPRDQLALPGTARRLAAAVALGVGAPIAGILLSSRVARLARAASARRRRARPWGRLHRALRRLRGRLDRIGPREFYIELTAALRSYLEVRHGLEATTSTTSELRDRMRALPSAAGEREAVEGLLGLLERADWVKFGQAAAERGELAAAAGSAEGCAKRLEEASVGNP